MSRCHGSKPDGTPCERIVGASQRFCYSHDDGRKAERSRNASRAGRSPRSGGELGEVRDLLREITDRVLDGSLDRGTAIAVNMVLNTRVRLIETARRVQEQEDLLERLAGLEERAAVGRRRA